ncbi:MAG TPA: hypothetical protein VNV85_17650 [Puia sp.]|nr:hypothetical protein [Puia sp.]
MLLVLHNAIQNQSSCVYTVFPKKHIDVFYINDVNHYQHIKVTYIYLL